MKRVTINLVVDDAGKFIGMDIIEDGNRCEYANEELEEAMDIDEVLAEITEALKEL